MMLKVTFLFFITALSVCQCAQDSPLNKTLSTDSCKSLLLDHLENKRQCKSESATMKNDLKNCSTLFLELMEKVPLENFALVDKEDCQKYLQVEPDNAIPTIGKVTCVLGIKNELPRRDHLDYCLILTTPQEESKDDQPLACTRHAQCDGATPYCLDGKCVSASDKVCVAEGNVYTGGLSCCYPMANPHETGLPCRPPDTQSCSRDVNCNVRVSDNLYVCCTNYREGKGQCIGRHGIPHDCEHEASGHGTAGGR